MKFISCMDRDSIPIFADLIFLELIVPEQNVLMRYVQIGRRKDRVRIMEAGIKCRLTRNVRNRWSPLLWWSLRGLMMQWTAGNKNLDSLRIPLKSLLLFVSMENTYKLVADTR